jgi:hypothetical protein
VQVTGPLGVKDSKRIAFDKLAALVGLAQGDEESSLGWGNPLPKETIPSSLIHWTETRRDPGIDQSHLHTNTRGEHEPSLGWLERIRPGTASARRDL